MTARAQKFAAATVLLLAFATSACGVRSDSAPRALSSGAVPYGLLDKSPAAGPTPPSTAQAPQQRVNAAVFFLSGVRLEPTTRSVLAPATPLRVITALLDGPTEEESLNGLRSAVNPLTEASVVRSAPDVVLIELSSPFAAVPRQEQLLALAQIVYTVTAIEGVKGVRFTLAGAPVEVPLPDGTLTSAPVSRIAFANVAPPERPPSVPA
jgi:hypothetical protein